MLLTPAQLSGLIEACHAAILQAADHLSELDRAIGDGDHGSNMQRGLEAVFADRAALSARPLPRALQDIGLALVMSIGGAAGPLYGTLLIEIGKALPEQPEPADLIPAFAAAVDAVARRGRSQRGDKTLLDVLYPLQQRMLSGAGLADIASAARQFSAETIPLQARRGRASFLGERSIGHEDPGAASSAVLIAAICDYCKEHWQP